MTWEEWRTYLKQNRLNNDDFFNDMLESALLNAIDRYCRQTDCFVTWKTIATTVSGTAGYTVQDLTATVPWIGVKIIGNEITWDDNTPITRIGWRLYQERLAGVTTNTPGTPSAFAVDVDGNDLKVYLDPAPNSAASLEGKTVSTFILNYAMERAEETIRKHENMSLNAKNSEIFINALSKDFNFNQKLTDAFEEHARRTVSK